MAVNLFIHTVDPNYLIIGLLDDGHLTVSWKKARSRQDSEVFGRWLAKLWPTFPALDGVVVTSGRGSFTASRLGPVVGNALAWTKNLPIISLIAEAEESLDQVVKRAVQVSNKISHKKFAPVNVVYDRQPSITLKD